MESHNPYQPPEAEIIAPPVDDDSTLAPRAARFVGALIDGLLQTAITVIALLIIFGGWQSYAKSASEDFLVSLLGLGISLASWLVLNGYLVHTRGQTIGKLLARTRILRRDGQRASLARIFLIRRVPLAIVTVLPLVGIPISLIDPLLIFRRNHACLHDDIADTKVVVA